MKINDSDRFVFCHAHVAEGWTRPWTEGDVRLNAGFSRLRLSRQPPDEVVACVGFDMAIDGEFLACPVSTKKIAVLWEPREINQKGFQFAELEIEQLFHVFSHDEDFLERYRAKASFFYTGGSYIAPAETLSAWPKARLISIAASKKRFLPGHHLRHEVIQALKSRRLVKMGSGYRPYASASAPYRKFMFSLVIENVRERRFFTEKLVHSLLYRCVPIYWGAQSLPRSIDERGIIRFDSLSQLERIIKRLSASSYRGLNDVVLRNQVAALDYASSELNLQRAIGPVLALDGLESDRAADYFADTDALFSGRAKFHPAYMASFN